MHICLLSFCVLAVVQLFTSASGAIYHSFFLYFGYYIIIIPWFG